MLELPWEDILGKANKTVFTVLHKCSVRMYLQRTLAVNMM